MAIKRRFTSITEDSVAETEKIGRAADIVIGIAQSEAEEAGEVEIVAVQKRKLTPTTDDPEFHMARLEAFCNGNRGKQPHPKDVPVETLLAGVQHVQNVGGEFEKMERFYRSRIRSPLTAIRAFVVLAEGGPKKANDDTGTSNPLWLFREGRNPFYGKFRSDEDDDDGTED